MKSFKKWQLGKLLFFSIPVIVFSVLAIFYFPYPFSKGVGRLMVNIDREPTTFDPIDYDWYSHQAIQSIANAKLFSSYGDAKTKPQLAKSWQTTNSGTEWEIELRDDFSFGTGRKVDVSDVVRSLQRIVFVSKNKKVVNGFVERLYGLDLLTKAYVAEFPGVSLKNGKLLIKLTKPTPNLPELLSFGLYAVVDPKNFNADSGEWRGQIKNYIGAGPYQISEVKNNLLTFDLKKNYPLDLRNEKAFPQIEFSYDANSMLAADIFMGTEDQEEAKGDFQFHSAGATSINYFRIYPWRSKDSPLNEIAIRRKLQMAFEKNYRAAGFRATRTFFPLILSGVHEVPLGEVPESIQIEKGHEVSFADRRPAKTKAINVAIDAMEKALRDLGFIPRPIKGLTYADVKKNNDPRLKKFIFDVALYGTEISVIEPFQDVLLMFSANGIDLPDGTGEIRRELEKDSFSIQKVNEHILNQAIILPVVQRAQGIWSRKSVNFSRYNSLLLLGDLQWLGEN